MRVPYQEYVMYAGNADVVDEFPVYQRRIYLKYKCQIAYKYKDSSKERKYNLNL